MKTFLFILINSLVGGICAQTELKKLEQSQTDLIILSKKQAAFQGQTPEAGTTIVFLDPTVSSEETKLIEEKIINYRNTNNQVILTNNDELNVTTQKESVKVPLSEFSSFPLNIQQYIVSKRNFYESYIKFD